MHTLPIGSSPVSTVSAACVVVVALEWDNFRIRGWVLLEYITITGMHTVYHSAQAQTRAAKVRSYHIDLEEAKERANQQRAPFLKAVRRKNQ